MKVMIISPFYPPFSSVAVVRMASLSRYLIEKGCEVTVLRNNISQLDKNSKKSIVPMGVEIVDVNVLNKGRYFRSFKKGIISYRDTINRILSKNKYDVVIISVGPFFTLSLCKLIKKKYNTKCILDFRDLWIVETHNGKDLLNLKKLLSKFVFYPIERTAVKYADKVITVTEGWKNSMKKFYPRYSDKMDLVFNGYDDDLLGNINNYQYNDNMVLLGVFGKLSYYSSNYSQILFKTVKNLKNKYKDLKIMQVGIHESETEVIMEGIEFNTSDFYCTGFLDYVNGIKKMQTARICILVDIRKAGLGTKIYDYIYLNKPIIYIGVKGTDLANLVSSLENGFVCDTVEELTKKIKYLLDENITYLSRNNVNKEYARSTQNSRYYSLINHLISE